MRAKRRNPLQKSGLNAKRPVAGILASGVHWIGVYVRRKTRSSPTRARTWDPAVNSRLLYRLSYRGVEMLIRVVLDRLTEG